MQNNDHKFKSLDELAYNLKILAMLAFYLNGQRWVLEPVINNDHVEGWRFTNKNTNEQHIVHVQSDIWDYDAVNQILDYQIDDKGSLRAQWDQIQLIY